MRLPTFKWIAGRFSSLCALMVLSSGCSSLLYHPTHQEHVSPSKLNLHPEDLSIPVEGSQSLHGWYFHAQGKKEPKAVIVFFHGNGENLSSHYLSLVWLLSQGYDFLIFDYRGYGRSKGSPSPAGTVEDGIAAVKFTYAKNPHLPLVILGQSLGGAVALRTVVEIKKEVSIQLVVVDSTFASYRQAARNVLSRHWLTWLFQPLTYLVLSDSASPDEKISEISPIPMVIIHGDQDNVIDFSLGEEVYRQAREPKEFWKIPGGRHTDSLWRKVPNTRERLLKKLDSLFCLLPCRPGS